MWIETGVALVRENFAGPVGEIHPSWEDLRGVIELEHGLIRLDVWRDEEARCWEGDDGPIAVDVVEFVELEQGEEPAMAEVLVRGLTSALAPANLRSVPVYRDGDLVGRIEL